jgi:outer membrane receptor protein involved in Fe transport
LLFCFTPEAAIAQQDDPVGAAGEGEAGDDELDVYGPDSDEKDDDIEVMKVRAGESDAAADFESGDSVQAFDAADLEALGAQSIADLASFTPNLEIVTSGATTPTFFIRGVGLNDFSANSSGAVAILFNDVPKNAPALQLGTLFDIENVNVLRGPQGTGNYRSASAGAIKIYTRKPTGQYNAYLQQSYGNYSALDIQGAVGAPIFEDIIAGRLAFRVTDRDGYQKNRCGGAPPFNERGSRDGDTVIGSLFGRHPDYSICGETVPIGARAVLDTGEQPPRDANGLARSHITPGLPKRLNDQGNWAARGTLLFQPTLDQEWLFTASGGERDEYTRVGQSTGTFNQLSTTLVGPFGKPGAGLLGSRDQFAGGAEGHVSDEIEIRRLKLDPCLIDSKEYIGFQNLDENIESRCFVDGDARTTKDNNRINQSNLLARQLLARDLARNLDDKPWTGEYNNPGGTVLDTWGVSLKGDLVIADSINVTTVTGYDFYDRLVENDLDQSPNQVLEITTDDQGWQVAQTVDVTGEIGDDSGVSWSAGGLFLYEVLDVDVDNQFSANLQAVAASSRQYRQKLWSGAAHLGFNFGFFENFVVDAGLRYNWERKSMDYFLVESGVLGFDLFASEVWQAPTGGVRLTFNFTETTYAYWKYTRGWKGGHYNAIGGRDGVRAAKPENIDSFEMGLHLAIMNGQLTADLSVFHYNYQNYQLFTVQSTFTGIEFVVLNADDAEVYGAELDLTLRPNKIGPWEWQGLMVRSVVGWLESQFLDFNQNVFQRIDSGAGFGSPPLSINNEIQNSGNPLLNSPRFKVSLTAQQTLPIGRLGQVTFRWDGAWTDDTTFDASKGKGLPNVDGDQFLPKHTIGQRAYWIHNARVAYTTPGGFEVAGWIRNIENKAYKNFAFDAVRLTNAVIYTAGEPRTFGVQLSTEF